MSFDDFHLDVTNPPPVVLLLLHLCCAYVCMWCIIYITIQQKYTLPFRYKCDIYAVYEFLWWDKDGLLICGEGLGNGILNPDLESFTNAQCAQMHNVHIALLMRSQMIFLVLGNAIMWRCTKWWFARKYESRLVVGWSWKNINWGWLLGEKRRMDERKGK